MTPGGPKRISSTVAVMLLIGAAVALSAQDTITSVEYRGGSNAIKKKVGTTGVIVLTDSVLQFIAYQSPSSVRLEAKPLIVIPLDSLTDYISVPVQKASAADPAVGTATTVPDGVEIVTLVYDTESTAQAPVFRLTEHMGGALIEKIKFRLRKMGRIPEGGGDSLPPHTAAL